MEMAVLLTGLSHHLALLCQTAKLTASDCWSSGNIICIFHIYVTKYNWTIRFVLHHLQYPVVAWPAVLHWSLYYRHYGAVNTVHAGGCRRQLEAVSLHSVGTRYILPSGRYRYQHRPFMAVEWILQYHDDRKYFVARVRSEWLLCENVRLFEGVTSTTQRPTTCELGRCKYIRTSIEPDVVAPASYFFVTGNCICLLTVHSRWWHFAQKTEVSTISKTSKPNQQHYPSLSPDKGIPLRISSSNIPCWKLRHYATF